ncbi:claudin-4-like isoform X2 [Parambassis ranga]|uniref:Claudin n=1 Tax=Parambassis ranga TaxID=210632 RepID=A0A6P7IQL8_9TELE|nr:claudin-4-like isoform X2 [Parambassis ranga]
MHYEGPPENSQEGLWMNCVVQSTGQQQCKNYDSWLVLPPDLQAARAMTLISCLLSSLSILILFLGAEFTNCVENEDVKPISLVAGVGMLLAGLFIIIPVSWSAHIVVRDFYNPLVVQSQKMELGVCIFVGWGAGALLLLAGGLLCCFSRLKCGHLDGTAMYYTDTVYCNVPTSVNKQHVE